MSPKNDPSSSLKYGGEVPSFNADKRWIQDEGTRSIHRAIYTERSVVKVIAYRNNILRVCTPVIFSVKQTMPTTCPTQAIGE